MKMKRMLFLVVVCTMGCTTLMAQQRQRMSEEERIAYRAEMVRKQGDRLAKEFGLKDEAKADFLNLYAEYQAAVAETQKGEKNDAANDGAEKKTKDLTVEEANKMVEEYFTQQESQIARSLCRLEVDKRYYEKFKQTLTPQQLARIFHRQQRSFNRQGGPQGGFGGPGGGHGGNGGQGGFPGGFSGGDF